jgi:hypothetical protein
LQQQFGIDPAALPADQPRRSPWHDIIDLVAMGHF